MVPIRSIIIFQALCLLLSCSSPTRTDKLHQQISRELQLQEGTFAIAFKNLTTGDELLINEHENFHAASTMKTPVMVEVFKQAAEGRFSLSDSVLIKNEFKSIADGSAYSLDPGDDSDQALYQQIGFRKTISDLVYDMIIVSSNLATNLVIELVNPEKVTQTMRDLGARDIQVRRGVEDSKAFAAGMNNTTTAYDLMLIYEKIAQQEMVSADACSSMTEILLDQRFNEIIPARLPTTVKVAHKTGNITGVQHDSGIVFLPDGRKYVLVVLSKGLNDESSAIKAMADISFMIYQHMDAK